MKHRLLGLFSAQRNINILEPWTDIPRGSLQREVSDCVHDRVDDIIKHSHFLLELERKYELTSGPGRDNDSAPITEPENTETAGRKAAERDAAEEAAAWTTFSRKPWAGFTGWELLDITSHFFLSCRCTSTNKHHVLTVKSLKKIYFLLFYSFIYFY